MRGVGAVRGGALYHGSYYDNYTRLYSPVTMSQEWPRLGRLLFMLFCSCLGTTMNGFFVAAFFVEHTLKKIGNVYLACTGVADLIITTGVIPCAAVVLLSGEWDTVHVCQLLHFLTQTSTYCYSLFFMLVATETYFRLCRSAEQYNGFISLRVGLIAFLIYCLCFGVSGLGVYLRLDYDYCTRQHRGNVYFRVITTVAFHAIPFLITTVCLILSAIRVHRKAREQTHYKRSQQYDRDTSSTYLNMVSYLLYVIAWTPYLIVVHEYPASSDPKYYHTVWIGVCRSVITSFLYSIANRNFRRAFAHLFNYCCCKNTLSGTFTCRHRRALEYQSATGDVRVHIMHQMLHSLNTTRASSSRDPHEL